VDASGTSEKLDAMTQEREALRTEVEKLRKQLESIQVSHASETEQLKTELDESEAAKEHAEAQYQTLLGRVEKIKETLGERLKRDRQELEEAKDRIEELETQNEQLQNGARAVESEIEKQKEELQGATRELASLRSQGNLSQQNWMKEREDMMRQMQHLKNELESTSNAMGEWEVIAMEERSVRESLAEKFSDLEEQLTATREAYERAAADRDTQTQATDGLQRALQEIQEARKRELREMVESSEEQLLVMRRRVQEADAKAAEAEATSEKLRKEVERTAPFEKEVKEKNLLIGKLRHEGIILNDHLTKALKYIKKMKPEESVDRYGLCMLKNHSGANPWGLTRTNSQASGHGVLPPVPHAGSLRSQEVPDPSSDCRIPELERRAAGASRPRAAGHLGQQPPAAAVALPSHAQHAVAQHGVLLRAHVGRGQGVARRLVGGLPRAERGGSFCRDEVTEG